MTVKTRFQQDIVVTGIHTVTGDQDIGGTQTIAGSMSLGTASDPDAKALLDMQSTTKGVLFPRMTTAERDAIASPPNGLTVYNTTTSKMNVYNSVAWVEVGSGSGEGGINYISANNGNSNAEIDTSGWTTFADGASLVDGTGGTATATFTRTTSSPLRGDASFLFTPGTLGDGVAYDFDIDSADKASMMTARCDYELSGTITEGDYQIRIYDRTNGELVQNTPYKLSGTSGLPYKFQTEFQTASNSTAYRFIIYQAASTSVTLKLDNISVGPSSYSYGPVITDWESWTPTGSWTGGTVTYSGLRKRVGDMEEYQVKIALSGVPTTATLTVNLPSGRTIDTAKWLLQHKGAPFGEIEVRDTGTAGYSGFVTYNDTTSVALLTRTVTGSDVVATSPGDAVTQANPITFGSGDEIYAMFSVPILGWGNSLQMSDSADTRVTGANYNGQPTGTLNSSFNTITYPTKISDTHNLYSSGSYTVKIPGQWDIDAAVAVSATFSVNQLMGISVFINGVEKYTRYTYAAASQTTLQVHISVQSIPLIAGDIVTIRARTDGSTPSFVASTALNYFSISRQSGPSAIAASEAMNSRYKTAAGQSIPNNIETVVDFGTLSWSTHGSVTTGSSWKFTASAAGKFSVKVFVALGANATGERYIHLNKNGSRYSRLDQMPGNASYAANMSGSDEVDLLAGEYINIVIFQNSGGALSLTTNDYQNYISIVKVD